MLAHQHSAGLRILHVLRCLQLPLLLLPSRKLCDLVFLYVCPVPSVLVLVTQSCSTFLQLYGLFPAKLLCPWNCPGKNTGVGSHSLLQGNLRDSGRRPWSPTLAGRFFTHLSHQGSPFCTYLYDHIYQRVYVC